MIFPFFFPATLILRFAGPEGAKNLAGKCPPPDSNPLEPIWKKLRQLVKPIRSGSNRRFQLNKCSQLFIRVHNETLSIVAMRVCTKDRSLARVHSCDAAQLQPALLRLSAMISQYFTAAPCSTRHAAPQGK
jgi:hypothetical protein